MFNFINDVHQILLALRENNRKLDESNLRSQVIALELVELNNVVRELKDCLCPTIVAIKIIPGSVTNREGDHLMNAKLLKKTDKPVNPLKAGADVMSFVLQDNGDDTCTVVGVDKAGNHADISGVATLGGLVSSDPSVLTVDPPAGMEFKMHAVGPLGHSDVSVTATWNDGSVGPFTVTLPVDVVAGPASGVLIVPGTPTVRE